MYLFDTILRQIGTYRFCAMSLFLNKAIVHECHMYVCVYAGGSHGVGAFRSMLDPCSQGLASLAPPKTNQLVAEHRPLAFSSTSVRQSNGLVVKNPSTSNLHLPFCLHQHFNLQTIYLFSRQASPSRPGWQVERCPNLPEIRTQHRSSTAASLVEPNIKPSIYIRARNQARDHDFLYSFSIRLFILSPA